MRGMDTHPVTELPVSQSFRDARNNYKVGIRLFNFPKANATSKAKYPLPSERLGHCCVHKLSTLLGQLSQYEQGFSL